MFSVGKGITLDTSQKRDHIDYEDEDKSQMVQQISKTRRQINLMIKVSLRVLRKSTVLPDLNWG